MKNTKDKMFAIIEISKLGFNQVSGAEKHNLRLIPVPNALPGGFTKRLFGDSQLSLHKTIKERIRSYNIKRVQVNTIVCAEVVLSASRDFFLQSDFNHIKDFDLSALTLWVKSSVAFLKEEFGEHILSIDLHLDEITPHIHAMIFPIRQKQFKSKSGQITSGWSLDFGNRLNKSLLSYYLDRYSAATKSIGLRRPEAKCKVNHTSLYQFYQHVYKNTEIEQNLNYSKDKLHKLNYQIEEAKKAKAYLEVQIQNQHEILKQQTQKYENSEAILVESFKDDFVLLTESVNDIADFIEELEHLREENTATNRQRLRLLVNETKHKLQLKTFEYAPSTGLRL